jgi:hypothetical protein
VPLRKVYCHEIRRRSRRSGTTKPRPFFGRFWLPNRMAIEGAFLPPAAARSPAAARCLSGGGGTHPWRLADRPEGPYPWTVLEEVLTNRMHRGGSAGSDVHLYEDGAYVFVYGEWRDAEGAGDFPIGVSATEEFQYRELASTEMILAVSLF